MSTASLVPETRWLRDDNAWRVLRRIGWPKLMKDSFRRMRVADGFSHARSFAFMTSLVVIQGMLAAVGLASVLHKGVVSAMIVAAVRQAVPGSGGHVLDSAVNQVHRDALQHQYAVILVVTLSALVTATLAMGQFERGLNRLYGIEQDRTSVKKYFIALVFVLSLGAMAVAAFVCFTFGHSLVHSANNVVLDSVWFAVRWPLGLVLMGAVVTILFRWSPRRAQPHLSWLAFGAAIAVFLWSVATSALGLFFRSSASFGATYGPLAGVVALLMWSLFSSISLFYGASLAAQLEAVRAGDPAPQDLQKVEVSEPQSA